jgi:hypothetical protein
VGCVVLEDEKRRNASSYVVPQLQEPVGDAENEAVPSLFLDIDGDINKDVIDTGDNVKTVKPIIDIHPALLKEEV